MFIKKTLRFIFSNKWNGVAIYSPLCVLGLLLFSACNELENSETVTQTQKTTSTHVELAFPGREGEKISIKRENGDVYSYENIDGYHVMEGDIILTDEQLELLRQGETSSNSRVQSAPGRFVKFWPKSQVNYWIPGPARRTDIEWAIEHIRSNTNIKFTEKRSGNYIYFDGGGGCLSNLGMKGGRQDIILAPNCSRGTIVHEILHALGIHHEQSRSDRDRFVSINYNNIQNGRRGLFETTSIDNYGTFDINSIMMYGPCSFAIACLPQGTCSCSAAEATITRKNGTLYNNNRVGLSPGDIDALRNIYPGFGSQVPWAVSFAVNESGDIAYAKMGHRRFNIYKNNVKIRTQRGNKAPRLEITDDGTVLSARGTIRYGSGRNNHYTINDIGAGGGEVYCVASSKRKNRLFRKVNGRWEYSGGGGSRVSVDGKGQPWTISSTVVSGWRNGERIIINKPSRYNGWYSFYDVACAGSHIFVTLRHSRTKKTTLFRYSLTENRLVRQPDGAGGNIDVDGEGNIW